MFNQICANTCFWEEVGLSEVLCIFTILFCEFALAQSGRVSVSIIAINSSVMTVAISSNHGTLLCSLSYTNY